MSDNRDDFIIAVRYALLKKGAKQKFSLFFLIMLSIGVITLDRFSVPFIGSTRAILNDLVYQVSIFTALPGKLVSYVNQTQKIHFEIVNKNKVLKEEIETLKSERYNSIYLKTENKSLKTMLNLDNSMNNGESLSIKARVLTDQKSPFLKSLIVNKGKKHKIIKGMSVLDKKYLIGTIIESNYLTARVLLITDLNSKIPVIIQDTDINAILTGEGKNTELVLEYLPEGFIPEPNKIIYTSGRDGFLTAGMPVAITYLNKNNELRVKSLSDPQQASIISIKNKGLSN